MPVTYKAFVYERSQFSGNAAPYTRIRRDITNPLFENLDYFQSCNQVKINYDDGQLLVARCSLLVALALHTAFEYVLAKVRCCIGKRSPLHSFPRRQLTCFARSG